MTAAETPGAEVAESFLRSAVGGPRGSRARARFHPLRVAAIRPLTEDAVEVTFAVPAALASAYDYLPGQHVALRREIDGRELRRSYSLCRPPEPGQMSVAIKRDRGGLFSTWAHTALRVGDDIDVMSPQGSFTTRLADLDGRHVAGVAAGSGITPLMALATTMLARSDTAHFTLLYTNRSARDIMFLEELADLKDRYPARFELIHVLTREKRAAPLLSGRLDDERLGRILDELIPPASIDEWFLCGPIDLVQRCRELLGTRGVPAAHVRYELFTTGESPGAERPARTVDADSDAVAVEITFTLDGLAATVRSPVDAHETILDAALRVRPDTPFACAGGVCGTCRARLLSGSVTMTENYALEPDEIEQGFVLSCQSHPTSERVEVSYDV